MLVNYNKDSGIGGIIPSIFGSIRNVKSLKKVKSDLSKITDQITFTKDGIVSLNTEAQKTIDGLVGTDKEFGRFIEKMTDSNQTFDNGLAVIEKYRETLKGSNKWFGPLIESLKSVGMSIVSMLATAAITYGIKKIYDAISNYVHRFEIIKGKAQEARDSIEALNDEFKSLSSSVNDNKQRYAELAQQVENLGKVNQSQGNLSTEEYDEFLDLSNQMAELFPRLTRSYDENGNAILDLSGDVDTIVESLNDLVEAQQKLVNQQVANKMPDVWAGYIVELDEYNKKLDEAKSKNEMLLDLLDSVGNAVRNDQRIQIDDMQVNDIIRQALRETGILDEIDISTIYDGTMRQDASGRISESATWDFIPLSHGSTQAAERLLDKLAEYSSEYQSIINEMNDATQTAGAEMGRYINSWLSNEWNYIKMTPDMQNVVKDVLLSPDFMSFLPDDVASSSDWNDVADWLQNNFLSVINRISNDDTKAAIINAFNDTLSLASLNDLVQNLLKSQYGFKEENPLILYLQAKITSAQGNVDYVKQFLKDEEKELANTLSPEDLAIIPNLEIPSGVILSWDQLLAKIEQYKEATAPSAQYSTFSDIMSDENFTGKVDSYIEKVNTLQEALTKLNSGDFEKSDFVELVKEFPGLADDTEDLEDAIRALLKSMDDDMVTEFYDQFGKVDEKSKEDVKALEEFMDAVLELGEVVGSTEFAIDFDAETEGVTNLVEAMKESVSSTGLSAESISHLKARYKDLESYDPARLFERTYNGIHLNVQALQELESEYEAHKKQDIQESLQDLAAKYNDLTIEIDNTGDAISKADLYAKRNDILDQINDVQILAAQYDALTSSFHKWELAQETPDENDMYLKMATSTEDIKELWEKGWIGTDDFQSYVQMMTDEDLKNASTEKILDVYKRGMPTIEKFFTENTNGLVNFLNVAEDVSTKLGKDWVKLDKETGNWDINFGVGGDEEVAKAISDMTEFQISAEQVQYILRAMSSARLDIKLDSLYSTLDTLGLLSTNAEEANEKLKELGMTDIDFSFNSFNMDQLNEQIESASALLDQFRNEDGTIDLTIEGAIEAKEVLTSLISQKQAISTPAIMSIDVNNISEANQELAETITALQEFTTATNDLEIQTKLGVDTTETEQKIRDAASSISASSDEVKVKLGIDSEEFNASLQSIINTDTDDVNVGVGISEEDIGAIQSTISAIEVDDITMETNSDEVIGALENVDDFTINNKEFNVTAVDNATPVINRINNTPVQDKNGYIYMHEVNVSSSSSASSVGKSSTSGGKSRAGGDLNVISSGKALGGENGPELHVHTKEGYYDIIGEHGAETFEYEKGDLIFNADQTKQILESGKISHGPGRAIALANGNVPSSGMAFSSGSGKITAKGRVITKPSGSSRGSSGSGSAEDEADEFLETFDWIEVLIDRIERAISNLDLTASSVYNSWFERNEKLRDEMGTVRQEIEYQRQGYERYLQQANSVGLSEEWAKKVRDGLIDIEDVTDESLANMIQDYQNWYEKAISCRDAVAELSETVRELYKTAFDNVVSKFDSILSFVDHSKSLVEEFINQAEEAGYIVNTRYYETLIQTEEANLEQLQKERDALLSSLADAVNNGSIIEGSEAWAEMQGQINDVTLAIEESTTAMIEYNNAIRDIEWQIFDLLQDKISQISSESDFLIDLLSNDELFDDHGQLTDEGMSTMGLHGVNYNVYMNQADRYAQEMMKINEELAKDPNNQTLAERRQELLELQQESILAAEDEKQAIVDLVEEGINKELESLKELIDNYNDAIDSQKELYDYQKQVSEQTKEIAKLQKQLSAYEGDLSEETKATVQQIKVQLEEARSDLEETEYNKFISDQKELLDSLYNEYELILNQRLDNIDLLISDMIDEINMNAALISDTLSAKADSVGYTLTDAMANIWSTSTLSLMDVVSVYGNSITNSITNGISVMADGMNNGFNSVNSSINNIAIGISGVNSAINDSINSVISNMQSMITRMDTIIRNTTLEVSTPTPSSGAGGSGGGSDGGSGGGDSGGGGGGDSSGYNDNFFIDKEDNYNRYNTDTSIVDRLKSQDYDSSFSARKGYWSEMGMGGTYTGSAEQNRKMLEWMQTHGYKNGVFNVRRNEIARTQEGGKPELIMYPDGTIGYPDGSFKLPDGSTLTDLPKGSSVLNPDATKALYDFANNPSDIMMKQIKQILPTQKISGSNINNDVIINVTLPNVMNYEQFKTAMQNDKQIERMFQAMTVGRVVGGSSLAKHKY